MRNQIYIAIVTGFGGIVLGFLLTQLGNYLQGYREDKRVLKQVLFNQLDMWFELKRADVETHVPLIVERLRVALLNRGIPLDEVNQLSGVSLAPLIGIFKSMKLSSPDAFQQRYQDSVNQLAKVDPLLAYQLSGRPQTNLNEVVDTFITKVVELEGEKAKAASATDIVTVITSFIKGYGQQRILSEMESDILDVAGEISYWTRFRTRQRITLLTARLSHEADQYIEKLINTLIQFAAQAPRPTGSDSGEDPDKPK